MTRATLEVLYFNEGLLVKTPAGVPIFIPPTAEGMRRLRQLAWNAADRAGLAGGQPSPGYSIDAALAPIRQFPAAGRELIPLEDM